MVNERRDGLQKLGMGLTGTVPVRLSDFTVSGSRIARLGLGFGAGCMIMCLRLSDDDGPLTVCIGTGCKNPRWGKL